MITRLFSVSLILICLYGPLPIVSSICRDFSCRCSENSGFTYVDCNLEKYVNSTQYDDVVIDDDDDELEEIEILTIQKALNGILPNDLLNGGYKIRLMVAVGLNLKALSPNVFDGVQSVRTLYLSANRLSAVNFNQFTLNFTENLESLVLNNNSFTEIPSFNGRLFRSLSYLDLSANKISDSKQIANLQSLETLEELNLGSNFLRSVNFSVFSSTLRLSLKRLRLDANKIEYITDLVGFRRLTLLSLYKNKIFQLAPTFFKGLPQLVALDLSWNRIIDLPRGIFDGLFKLEWLSLANNKLSMLKGDEFEDLKSINLLELQNNRLEIFHLKWLEYAVELITLDLSKNLIDTLEFGIVLSNLRVLRLSDNKIESIGEPINFLPDLKRLYIDGNKISRLPRDVTNLVVLDASNQNGTLKMLPDNAFQRRDDGGVLRINLALNPGLKFSAKSFCFENRFPLNKYEFESSSIDIVLSNMAVMNMDICMLTKLSSVYNETRLYILEDGFKNEKNLAKNHEICSSEANHVQNYLSSFGILVKNCQNAKISPRKVNPHHRKNKMHILTVPKILCDPKC